MRHQWRCHASPQHCQPLLTISGAPSLLPPSILSLQVPQGVLQSGNVTPLLKTLHWLCICLQDTSQTPECDPGSLPPQAGPQPSFQHHLPPFSIHPGVLGMRKTLEKGERRAPGKSSAPSVTPAFPDTFWTYVVPVA